MEDGDRKYGSVVVYDHEGVQREYAEGMPFFVLLGQDKLVPGTIDDYAVRADNAALDAEREGDEDLAATLRGRAESARRYAVATLRWQIEHPDQVKFPD